MGDFGKFAESDWDKLDQMIQINMTALTHLTHALLPSMKRRQSGSIINVSSLASILPIPDFSVYAATKAYVTSFSEGLRLELRKDNIRVSSALTGIERDKARVYPGWKVALAAAGISILPIAVIRMVMAKRVQ